MLAKIIIGLIAIVGVIAYDLLHQKPTFDQLGNFFSSSWLKYVAAFAISTFGYSFLSEWKIWQYVELAGSVVLIWCFWGIIFPILIVAKNWILGLFKKKS
jgi:hypothetical protein